MQEQLDAALCRESECIADALQSVILEASIDMSSGTKLSPTDQET